MNTRFYAFFAAFVAILLLPFSANSQTITTLLSQDFSSESFPPSGWTANSLFTYGAYSTGWVWSSGGAGASNGSAVAQTYVGYPYTSYPDPPPYSCYAPTAPYEYVGTLPNGTYTDGSYLGPLTLTSPTVDVSSFPATDTQFVDFDVFLPIGYFEYYSTYYYGNSLGLTITVLDGSTVVKTLKTGTSNSSGTFVSGDETYIDNGNTGGPDDPSGFTSSSYWQHYHLALPRSTTTQSVAFNIDMEYSTTFSCHAWYTFDVAFDNVTITNADYRYLTVNGPTTLNFGTVPLGLSAGPYYTKLSNPNSTPITLSNYAVTGANPGDFTITRDPESIPAGGTDSIGILYSPLGPGARGAFLTFNSNAIPGSITDTLIGTGIVPEVSYSTKNMFRGVTTELTDSSPTQFLYVNSTGLGPLTINSVTFFGPDANNYIVSYLPAGPIPGGSVDSIGIRFVPTIEGQPDAHMVVSSNAFNIPSDTVSLYGVGILPHLAIDSAKSWPLPTMVNFDSVNLGTQSCVQVLLTNPGSDTLAIEKNYFESADVDFSLTPLTGRDTLIPPGGSKQIQVCFTPVQQGTRVATLRIKTNIPNTETKPPQDTSSFVVNIIGVGNPVGTGILETLGGPNGDTLTVGTQLCEIDTFRNTGTGILTIDSILNISHGSATFTFPSFPFIIAPDSSVAFTCCVLLNDTGLSNGVCLGGCAAMIVYTKETGSWSQLALTNYGIKVGDTAFVVQPFSGACGTDTEQILVMNTENVPEAYTASISGANAADFTVLAPTTSPVESAGGTAIFNVIFTPSTASVETATFNVTGGISLTVPLTAKGGAATIGGQGTAATAAPSAPAEQFFDTVTNTGTCPWTPGIPTLADNVDFTYESGATTPIPAGGTGLLTFLFNPSATVGSYSSNVAFPNSVGLATAVSNTVYGTVAVSDVAATSSNGFSLDQNYPNPFNQTSQFEITLPVACLVHLSIIDVEGQVVETLLNQHYDSGSFEVTLDASGLASGTYYYQMIAGTVTLTKQMVILK